MKRNMSEYDSIRNEIISMEEQQRSVWINMYVLFVALFVLGIEFSYHLFLVTYIVLIPFQVVINRYNWSITKLSTYIRVFYEESDSNVRWESLHVYSKYKNYYKKINSSVLGVIRYTGATQLGFLATLFYNIFWVYEKVHENTICFNLLDIVLMVVSILLFCIAFILNKEYYKNYTEELEYIIRKYKNRCIRRKNKK